jgi:hypothetical protein
VRKSAVLTEDASGGSVTDGLPATDWMLGPKGLVPPGVLAFLADGSLIATWSRRFPRVVAQRRPKPEEAHAERSTVPPRPRSGTGIDELLAGGLRARDAPGALSGLVLEVPRLTWTDTAGLLVAVNAVIRAAAACRRPSPWAARSRRLLLGGARSGPRARRGCQHVAAPGRALLRRGGARAAR